MTEIKMQGKIVKEFFNGLIAKDTSCYQCSQRVYSVLFGPEIELYDQHQKPKTEGYMKDIF